MTTISTFRFKKLDSIGNPSAESDTQFLSACFVDTGELNLLRDCTDERGIVVGRTGAGKTALLKMLSVNEERAVLLDPHDLAISYISDSTIIRFFETLNIRMDQFYKLLWKHVFLVEILKRHFNLDSEEDRIKTLDYIRYNVLRKKVYIEAFEYLNTWGTTFWETTEDRIKEITKKFETELQASADVGIHDLMKMGGEGTRRLSEEERREVTHHSQEVIHKTQLNKLSLLFKALNEEILTDPKKKHFIIVDRLDEDWADDSIRYRLIRALIETMRELNSKVRFAKVVIALRADLLDLVLKATTDSGFQDEKYRGLCIPITWSKPTLIELLDNRISELVQRRYTGKSVSHKDLLPATIGNKKEQTINYMLDRTLLRPRDLINFFNLCINNAEDEPCIKAQQLLQAEMRYSQERLRSITDEWSAHYPCLASICNLLKKKAFSFKLGEISEDDLTNLCVEILDPEPLKACEDIEQFRAYYNDKIKGFVLRSFIAQTLYRVGIVGLKTDSFKEVIWSNSELNMMSAADINDNTIIQVHKMFWRALGIIS